MIRVWPLVLDAPAASVAEASRILSEVEKASATEHAEPFRSRFVLRRALRRLILASLTGIPADRLQFGTGPEGKPVLAGPGCGLHFSAAHASASGLLAVCEHHPVGADLEASREMSRLASSLLSPAERMRGTFDDAGLLRVWTGKEAALKALGRGLRLTDLPLIDLDLAEAPFNWRPVRFCGDLSASATLSACWFEPLAGHTAALAAPRPAEIVVEPSLAWPG